MHIFSFTYIQKLALSKIFIFDKNVRKYLFALQIEIICFIVPAEQHIWFSFPKNSHWISDFFHSRGDFTSSSWNNRSQGGTYFGELIEKRSQTKVIFFPHHLLFFFFPTNNFHLYNYNCSCINFFSIKSGFFFQISQLYMCIVIFFFLFSN